MKNSSFAIGKKNYLYLAIGFLIIILGFVFMAGGKPETPSVFNPEVFSFTRITLAPILVVLGFIVVGFAIIKKPKETKENQ
ncbi:MAG: DUF3098 domain-containing protein [Bacteroidota bacterium]